MPVGTATVNFGSAPGASTASIAVTGQGAILSTSYAEAWLMADTTSAHNADEHKLLASYVSFVCGNNVAGIGFTIYATSTIGNLTGTVSVRWVWN